MQIIDAHAHIFPPAIAQAAVKATNDFYREAATPLMPLAGNENGYAGTADDLIMREKAAGISKVLVFSCATSVRQVVSVNSFIARQCELHPEFIGAGTMHIGFPDMEAECDRMLSLGLKGVKLHPDIQRFAVDDEELFPLYEVMQHKRMFLIVHAGDYRYDYSGPKRLAHVAEEFPGLKMVCAHLGGWSEWDAARGFLNLGNVYFDTSSTIPFAGSEPVKMAFSHFDRTHIFFGTDYPMWNPQTELNAILSLGLDDDTLEGVLHRNFERFLASD